jgi:hypothetical protein
MSRHQEALVLASKIANLADERPWIGRSLSGRQVTGPAKAGPFAKTRGTALAYV